MILSNDEKETVLEKYQAMTRWERAEWIKQEVIKSINLGQDIKAPIFKAILMEELRFKETLQMPVDK